MAAPASDASNMPLSINLWESASGGRPNAAGSRASAWWRSPGMGGRDQSELVVAITRYAQTFNKPRIISCAELFPKHLALPRGCLDDGLRLLSEIGITTDVRDERQQGTALSTRFLGQLTPVQNHAATTLLKKRDRGARDHCVRQDRCRGKDDRCTRSKHSRPRSSPPTA